MQCIPVITVDGTEVPWRLDANNPAALSAVDKQVCDLYITRSCSVRQAVVFCHRQRSSRELIAQGSHVEYSAGGMPYPDTIEEYDNNKKSRRPVSSKL